MKNYCIESKFVHRGLKCVVVMQRMGHRCGYVGVPKEHRLFGKNYTDYLKIKKADISDKEVSGILPLMFAIMDDDERIRIEAYFQVHGGITFSGGRGEYPIQVHLWWFGFDCAHYEDMNDYESAKKLFSSDLDAVRQLEELEQIARDCGMVGEIRSFKYAKDQCKKLAEQLADFKE